MSKHCEVCNRSYPDHLGACPHCAEVLEVAEADVVELADETPEVELAAEPEVVAEAVEPHHLGETIEPATISLEGPDSSVDLGLPALPVEASGSGSSASGLSVIEWASLVEEGPAPAEPAAASFDDPADAHLIHPSAALPATVPPFAAPPAAAHAPDEDDDALSADLDAVRTIFAGDASASFVRRGADQPAAPATAEDDSALNLLAPDAEKPAAVGTPPVQGLAPEVIEAVDSGIDLASADLEQQVVDEAAGAPHGAATDSGIDLASPFVPEGGSDELSVVEAADSGLDLAADPADARPISDAGIDLSGGPVAGSEGDSGPQAGIEKNTPGTSESGRDLIAEGVESGTDFPLDMFEVAGDSKVGNGSGHVQEFVVGESGTGLAAGQLPSEAEEVDLTERPVETVDSSAVDLGASATFPAAPPEPAPDEDELNVTRPYEAKSKSIHGEEEVAPSEVDLGSRHDGDVGSGDFFEASAGLGEAPSAAPEDVEGETLGLASEGDGLSATAEENLEPADADTAAAEEEEEEAQPRRPAKPPMEKQRSTAGAWAGGVVLGGLVGTVACLALWLFNIEPPKSWRGYVPGGTTGGPTMAVGPTGQAAAPAAVTFADRMDMIRSGDLDRAQKAGIDKADESKPEELEARGEYLVRNYLRQRGANPNDEGLKKGLDDLEKSKDKSERALLWLGVAKEATKDYAGAEKVYKEGAERFKDDPAKRQPFEAALNRLSWKLTDKPAGMGAADPALDAALLAIALLAPDEPQAKPPQAQPEPPAAGAEEEAGTQFWMAVGLARDQRYAEAVKELDKAAETHEKRRFAQLGRAQNPDSDPTEEIFLRSAAELKSYWRLEEKLHASTLPVVKGKAPAEAVEALLADDKDQADKLAKAVADAEANKTDLEKAKKDAEEARKETESAKKDLDSTKKDLDTAKSDLESAKKGLADAEKKSADLGDKLKLTEAAVAKEGDRLKEVAAALTPKFLKPDAGAEALVPAVKDAARLGAIADPQGMIRGLETQAAALKNTLGQRWEPEQMLTFWTAALRDRARKELAEDAIADADRVLKADKGNADEKARAHAVKGFALRNQEKYDEAKAELEQAKADLPKADGEWVLETRAALTEVSDPSAHFLARAESLRKEGRNAESLAALGRALELAAPAAKGRLVAKRGAWELDDALARGKGHAGADDRDLAAARADADEAKKAGGPEAFYLSGRIAEAAGRWDAAAEDYRQALTQHGTLDADGALYRAALARVLTQPRAARPGPVGRGDAAPMPELLAALLGVALQPAGFPTQLDPSTREALKLADEILSMKEGDAPFEARAQAYAVKGLWTQALRVYVEGLSSSLSPEHAAGLLAIIEGHPSLRRPTIMTVADPLEAEKHYAAGLNWYTDRQYAKAEKEFFTAVENDGQDARFYYYLGLARLMQGDRDAYEDFDQGARLELRNQPGRAAVSAALERVQGGPRDVLNDVRNRPR